MCGKELITIHYPLEAFAVGEAHPLVVSHSLLSPYPWVICGFRDLFCLDFTPKRIVTLVLSLPWTALEELLINAEERSAVQ